jgi:hypothetical protein
MNTQIFEDEVKVEKAMIDESEAEHKRSVIYNETCKNAGVSIEKFHTEEIPVDQFKIVVDPTKCQNKRRNGSAFCQECSDKHNK